jgi:serine/threonine protein phosphatase PrpC
MEDSHVANLDVGDGVAVFGVFDGHGGKIILL